MIIMLKIDMNNTFLKIYHNTNKTILPLYFMSFLNYKYNTSLHIISPILYSGSTLVSGYHSYFSTSAIISDYIKPVKLNQTARVLNFKTHLIATYGFLYYIYQQNKEI